MADNPESRSSRREVWVGLFVILGVLSTLGTLFALTDPALFRGRYVVSTIVTDAAGVRRGDPVQLRGVNIGRVQRFLIEEQAVRIQLEVEGEYEFPADSKVTLRAESLLGGTVVDIDPGKSTQMAKRGDTLPGTTEPGLMETAGELARSAKESLARAQRMLSDENIANLQASTRDLAATLRKVSGMVDEQRQSLAALEASLQKSSEQVRALVSQPELQGLPAQMSATMARLDQISDTLDRSTKALDVVAGRVERGEGTLGQLTKDASLYEGMNDATTNLNKAARELATLIEDIKRQPKKYLKFSVF